MLDKANKLLLSAQSHVHSLKDIEDLNFYEDMKKSHLDEVNSLEVNASAEVLGVLDKIRILYRFSDNYVVPRIKSGAKYYMRGGIDIGM